MNSLPSHPNLRSVFGKAFLIELRRGNVQKAVLFAKAFLIEHTRSPKVVPQETMIPIILN